MSASAPKPSHSTSVLTQIVCLNEDRAELTTALSNKEGVTYYANTDHVSGRTYIALTATREALEDLITNHQDLLLLD